MTTTGTETVTPAQTQTADVTSPIVTDGAQPVVASPVVEVNPPAPAAAATDPAAATSSLDPANDTEAPKVTPKWAQDRINELTAKRHDAERKFGLEAERARAAEELLAKMTNSQPAAPGTPPVTSPKAALGEEEVERRANEKAMQMARQIEFNKTCNQVAETGQKEFKDWGDALKNLAMVGATGEGSNPEFLATAVELKSPHKVLHYLGTNLDQATRIVGLPPQKMALELARLEATLNAPAAPTPAPAVSSAPAPITPLAGTAKAGPADINDPNLSPDEWFALRSKQVADRKNRYQKA